MWYLILYDEDLQHSELSISLWESLIMVRDRFESEEYDVMLALIRVISGFTAKKTGDSIGEIEFWPNGYQNDF